MTVLDLIVSRVAALLEIPVLDGADDVGRSGSTELEFDHVADVCLRIGEQEVELPALRLAALNAPDLDITQPEQAGILLDLCLQRTLGEVRVTAQARTFRSVKLH